jgi:hypothetical protein
MSNNSPFSLANGLKTAILLLASSLALHATVPRGWYIAGSKPAEYESGIDGQVLHDGSASAYLKAKLPVVEGFGTLMQDFQAERYAGKRVRFSAFVKTQEARNWAGLWMRIDKGTTPVAMDNMRDRPLKGTSDWQNYQVVLDVPEGATGIFLGVLLNGAGTVWLSGVKFEVVGSDASVTGNVAQRPAGPTNLEFLD